MFYLPLIKTSPFLGENFWVNRFIITNTVITVLCSLFLFYLKVKTWDTDHTIGCRTFNKGLKEKGLIPFVINIY